MHPATPRAATAIVVLLVAACSGGSGAGGGDAPDTSPPAAVTGSTLPSAPAPTVVTAPPGTPEGELAPVPLPDPDDLGPSWIGELLRGTGAIDPDMASAAEEVESALVADARAQVDTATRPAPSTGSGTTASGWARRAPTASTFVDLGIMLVGTSDALATTPGVEATAGGTSTSTGPRASGSITAGIGGGTDAAGVNTAKVAVDIEVTSDDGRSVSVAISAQLSGQPCPLDDGVVQMRLEGTAEVRWAGATTGHGSQHFTGTLTAYFDDEGEAGRIDLDLHVETSRSGQGGTSSYVEFTHHNQISNLFGDVMTEAPTSTIDRRSSTFDPAQQDDARMAADAQTTATRVALGAFTARRARIQDNGCVTVQATAPASVGAGEQVQIEVHTFHVVDRVELDKRIDARLTGDGTIDPEHLATTAGTITYTAGDSGGASGTIALESRSRRGIGRASVTITVRQAYRIDQQVGDLHIWGDICGLEPSFALAVDPPAQGTLVFTATGPDGGTYAGDGQVGDTEARMVWSGTYTLRDVGTDHATLFMAEGTTTMTNIPVIGEAPTPGFWGGGVTFELAPVDTCSGAGET